MDHKACKIVSLGQLGFQFLQIFKHRGTLDNCEQNFNYVLETKKKDTV